MAEGRASPLLYPVLRLQMIPAPEIPPARGKGRESIVVERLVTQQRVLSSQVRGLRASQATLPAYAGRVHVTVSMFAEDSLAPTHTPKDLFALSKGCQLVAPFRNGYIVEADVSALHRLLAAIEAPRSLAERADISRVETIAAFDQKARLRGRSVQALWDAGTEEEDGRLFMLWLAPFRNPNAQEDLLRQIGELAEHQVLIPTFSAGSRTDLAGGSRALTSPTQSSVARLMRDYRNTGVGRAMVKLPTRESLVSLLASGASHRIDPIRPILVAAPAEGNAPQLPMNLGAVPTVAVIDGGLHATSYKAAEAWRAPPLVSDTQADRIHGNAVTSLVVQAHAWNTGLSLPALECRVGSVQAVPHPKSNRSFDEKELLDYLTDVVRAHPETRVWNISANHEVFDPDEVSALGHEIGLLARAAGILPVVAVGNASATNNARPNPPADCEAAIVVGGRVADKSGKPATGCPACLPGPGPDGMMKPDLSWFSTVRMLGGTVATGSSYATPLVSSLAAHTFSRLRDPSPDMVKALLINGTERDEHDPRVGWGTPYESNLPWTCAPGSVTLAWRANLEPGLAYYWNEIPVPPEIVKDGKLHGRARLTAVLRPLVSPYGGANYFSSRLQVSLMHANPKGKWVPLLGSMAESTLAEQDARAELRKWQPVRRHANDFSRGRGHAFSGRHLKLFARVFMRDLYQFGWTNQSQAGAQEVAFALTLWGKHGPDSIYDSTAQALGNFVESAVVDQDIEIESS